MIPDFVHIHNHSTYSRFDGFSNIEEIVTKAKQCDMRAVALTDHGTVAGIIHFLKVCKNENIKPILGCECYMARNYKYKSKDKQPDLRRGNRHINVLAKNLNGYKNLCRLAHFSSIDGYYYDPRIDIELLDKYKDGLIVTSACLSNVINANLVLDQYDKAKEAAKILKDIFGDDFYLEIMYHGIDKQAKIIPDIIKLGKELNIKIIATNDNHYLNREDAKFHEVLVCMSEKKCIKDPRRLKFPYEEFYFKSKEEMAKIFGHKPEFLRNTIEIAEKCDYSELKFVEDGGTMRLPKYNVPTNEDSYSYLCRKARQGLKRFGLDKSPEHVQRLELELSDIKLAKDVNKYDFDIYILIVSDIIEEARKRNIPCGIRGSGCGSLILFCLGLTEGIDPIEYELLWERFLGFDSKYFITMEDFN